MTNQVFIPVTDELMFNNPEEIEGPLVPYFAGMECHHWLSVELNPKEDSKFSRPKSRKIKRMNNANLRLAYSNA